MLKKKILVAEDDADDRQFFNELLQSRDDMVLMPIAENGVEVVAILERLVDETGLPDLIILDQNMPKQNGLQTLQSLKADPRFAHIPVTIYSTYTHDALVKIASDLGACQVVSKPLTREGYHHMMNDLFKACI